MLDCSMCCFSLRYWAAEQQRRKRGQKARLLVAISKCLSWRLFVQAVLQATVVSVCVCVCVHLSEFLKGVAMA